MFKLCFGLDYSDCRDALSDYLHIAASNPLGWSTPVPTVSRLWFRSAKPEEVDWFKGEWNRLVLTVVERDFPTLLPAYRRLSTIDQLRCVFPSLRRVRHLRNMPAVYPIRGVPGRD